MAKSVFKRVFQKCDHSNAGNRNEGDRFPVACIVNGERIALCPYDDFVYIPEKLYEEGRSIDKSAWLDFGSGIKVKQIESGDPSISGCSIRLEIKHPDDAKFTFALAYPWAIAK